MPVNRDDIPPSQPERPSEALERLNEQFNSFRVRIPLTSNRRNLDRSNRDLPSSALLGQEEAGDQNQSHDHIRWSNDDNFSIIPRVLTTDPASRSITSSSFFRNHPEHNANHGLSTAIHEYGLMGLMNKNLMERRTGEYAKMKRAAQLRRIVSIGNKRKFWKLNAKSMSSSFIQPGVMYSINSDDNISTHLKFTEMFDNDQKVKGLIESGFVTLEFTGEIVNFFENDLRFEDGIKTGIEASVFSNLLRNSLCFDKDIRKFVGRHKRTNDSDPNWKPFFLDKFGYLKVNAERRQKSEKYKETKFPNSSIFHKVSNMCGNKGSTYKCLTKWFDLPPFNEFVNTPSPPTPPGGRKRTMNNPENLLWRYDPDLPRIAPSQRGINNTHANDDLSTDSDFSDDDVGHTFLMDNDDDDIARDGDDDEEEENEDESNFDELFEVELSSGRSRRIENLLFERNLNREQQHHRRGNVLARKLYKNSSSSKLKLRIFVSINRLSGELYFIPANLDRNNWSSEENDGDLFGDRKTFKKLYDLFNTSTDDYRSRNAGSDHLQQFMKFKTYLDTDKKAEKARIQKLLLLNLITNPGLYGTKVDQTPTTTQFEASSFSNLPSMSSLAAKDDLASLGKRKNKQHETDLDEEQLTENREANTNILNIMQDERFKVKYGNDIEKIRASIPTVLLPLSMGKSSLVLLDIIISQLQEQSSATRAHLGFKLIVLCVDEEGLVENVQNIVGLVKQLKESYGVELLKQLNISFKVLDPNSFINKNSLKEIHLGQEFEAHLVEPINNNMKLSDILLQCPNKSTREDFLGNIRTELIYRAAIKEDCSVILFGHSMTKLADDILALTARGRGSEISKKLTDGDITFMDNTIHVIHPLRDVLQTEINAYAILCDLVRFEAANTVESVLKKSAKNKTINELIREYFATVEVDYPEVISTVDVEIYRLKAATPVFKKRRDLFAKIPRLWYIVLAEHEDFQEYIQTDDMKFLEYIKEIYVDYMSGETPDPSHFSITFEFESPNNEIANQIVTKQFTKYNDPESGKERLKSSPVKISWPDEFHKINPELIKQKQKTTKLSSDDKKNYRIGMKSFFAFFSWTGEKSGKEYRHGEDLALLIVDDLFPHATTYYTEAAPGLGEEDGEDDIDGSSGEELDLGEDDSDGEDEEKEPATKKQKVQIE
ncbi:hypothetical protein CANARDRAFT_194401 [[Candida] arabinofermentans NRRL YB-2248]|uniref:Uncharacterized protein n=1 Tax=[Candida] arabinofermentans NRRL YB-2248 TaxID=983967 RepID=A0A1E4T6W2_9ASCO|nr:hypothetical protein CANARDRAFT_194401 [[Candida] arabinofermentans NRRL YB-2248]